MRLTISTLETVDDEFGEMKMPEPKPEIEETVAKPEVEKGSRNQRL